jgi:hypothetical protein
VSRKLVFIDSKRRFLGPILACLLFSTLFSVPSLSQTRFRTNGNWDVAGNWQGNNIGDAVTESVSIEANATIKAAAPGNSYTVGNVTMNTNTSLTIDGTLNVGDASNARNFTGANNSIITVNGTFNITGSVIIKGNVVLNNGATLTVSGDLTIDGNLTGENNTDMVVSGSVSVGGSISVDNNSDLSGCNGCVTTGGGCSGPASFCGSSALPVTMLYFKATSFSTYIQLEWATSSEENFHSFTVQKTTDGITFVDLGSIQSKQTNGSLIVQEYTFADNAPQVGNNYYRLKTTDLDGSVSYFGLVSAAFEGERQIRFYPNPVQRGEEFIITLNYSPTENYQAEVLNLLGNKVLQLSLSDIQNKWIVGESLAPGVYLLKIGTDLQFSVHRIVVK